MIKLYIQQVELPRFKNILSFWVNTQSKVFINKDGIDFKHDKGNGSVGKDFFVDYAVQGSKFIQLPNDKKQFNSWVKSFKEIEVKNGRRGLVEICF